MAVQSRMDILHGKLFYVYIINLMTKQVSLPEFMISSSVPSIANRIIHVGEDDPLLMAIGSLVLTQGDLITTLNAVHYMPHVS